jgi:hypothetical protein
MKRIFLVILAIGLFTNILNAQNASYSSIEVLKIVRPCVMNTYNFSQDLLDETIKKKFAEAKVDNPDKSKGYKIYRGVSFPAFGSEKLDIYIKTDGKKETSICYIAVSKGYDNFLNPTTDSATMAMVAAWMNELNAGASKVELTHKVEESTDMTNKAEKKYKQSVDDGDDYQKQLEKLKNKIEENKNEQARIKKEMEDEQAKLKALKEKLDAAK